jgi:hypothetical protein
MTFFYPGDIFTTDDEADYRGLSGLCVWVLRLHHPDGTSFMVGITSLKEVT